MNIKPMIIKNHFSNYAKEGCEKHDTIICADYMYFNEDLFVNIKDTETIREYFDSYNIDDKVWQDIYDVIQAGNVDENHEIPLMFAYLYCLEGEKYDNLENTDMFNTIAYMRQVIIDSGNAYFALMYCDELGADKDMRQVVLDARNPMTAYEYCAYIANDSEVRQIIIDANSSRYAYAYCRNVSNDADMREIIPDADLKNIA